MDYPCGPTLLFEDDFFTSRVLMNFTIDETFSLYSYIIRIEGFSYYTLAHIFF